MICCCSLAGTLACFSCPSHIAEMQAQRQAQIQNPGWAQVFVRTQPIGFGWICPRCNKVNAPDVKECLCKELEVKA
jgi:hypothetical protein